MITGVFLIFLFKIKAALTSSTCLWSTLIKNRCFAWLNFSLSNDGEALNNQNWPRNNDKAESTASLTSDKENFLSEIISKTTYLFFCLNDGNNFILSILPQQIQNR